MKKEVKVLCIYSLLFLLLTISVFAFTITLQRPADNEFIGPGTPGFPLFQVNVTIDSLSNITLVNVTIAGIEICSNSTLNLTEYICTWNVSLTGEGVFTVIANATNSSAGSTSAVDNSTNVTLDFTPPTVINVTAEPSILNQTQSTNITVNVTDNTTIDTVLANITFPNATSRIFTMTNLAGDIFNLSFIPGLTAPIGVYNVTIIANDTLGNLNNTETTNFTVLDNTPPEVINLTAEPNIINQTDTTNITVNITDNINVDTVLANITFPNATSRIFTMTNLAGDIFNLSFIPGLTAPIGVYNVTIIANDTSGNLNNTETTNFTVLDNTPPSVTNLIPTGQTFTAFDIIEIAANVTDNDNVSSVRANITRPDSTTQLLTLTQVASTIKFNSSFTIPSTTGVYNIRILANDTSNNLNNTETTTFTTNPFIVAGVGGRGGGGGGGSARRFYSTNQIGPLQITPRYSGTNVTIYSSARPYILFNDQTYSMVIRSLRSHFLEFSIGFTYYKIILGQNISIDLDNDQSDDIKIELVKTVFNSADLIVSRLKNPNDPMSLPVEEQTEEEPTSVPIAEPIKEEPTTNKISPPPITGRATIDTPKQKSKTGLIGAVALIGLLGFLFFRFRKSNQ